MNRPTITHRYPLKYVFAWTALIVFTILMVWAIMASAQKQVDVPGCRQVKYPEVCAASYHKCDNIDLDEACLAVSQLDGEIGHSFTHNANEPMSQNIKTGDKPVERVHN